MPAMTTPPPPPPQGSPYPPPPGQHPGYPPPGFYPPPPRKRGFWSSATGILTILGLSIVAVVLFCGGLAAIGKVGDDRERSKIDARITSCGGNEPVATVGYTVTNNGAKARRVRLDIEYRDSSGARIDTDTAYVGEVPAGDTVRGEESTILNAVPADGRFSCEIVKVH